MSRVLGRDDVGSAAQPILIALRLAFQPSFSGVGPGRGERW